MAPLKNPHYDSVCMVRGVSGGCLIGPAIRLIADVFFQFWSSGKNWTINKQGRGTSFVSRTSSCKHFFPVPRQNQSVKMR